MAKPKLTREECADIKRMYRESTHKGWARSLTSLFHVNYATISRVIDGKYTPLEDYEEKRVFNKKTEKADSKTVFDQDRIYYSRDYGEAKTVVMTITLQKLTLEQCAEIEAIHERLFALAQKVTQTDKQTLKEER